jgi:phytoene dehydrogenase-like protein
MERADWVEVKKRLKRAVDQGMKVLKEGSDSARYAAGQTAHVLQLEMDVYALKNRIAKSMAELGEAVYNSRKGGKIQTNAEIERIIGDLETMKASVKKKQSEIHRTHLTRSNGAAKPRKKAH